MKSISKLDLQFLNAIRIKPDCLPSVPPAVVLRLTAVGYDLNNYKSLKGQQHD